MFSQSIKATWSALRMLFKSWVTLPSLVLMYGGLLGATYLFVSTREATVSQLVLTLCSMVVVPVLFFGLQAVSINYATVESGLVKKTAGDGLKLVVVTVPLIVLALLAVYGLGKLNHYLTAVTALRYLLVGIVVPLVAIHLWLAVSRNGLRSLVKGLHRVVVRAFAPQSVLVYACGVIFFVVAPYFLIFKTTQSERAWLEFALLAFRLLVSALLVLLGWVTTVGTLSLLSRPQQQ